MHLPVKPLNKVILKGIDTLVKLNEVKIFPFLNSYLTEFSDPPNPENLRPHASNSNENVTHYSLTCGNLVALSTLSQYKRLYTGQVIQRWR